MLLDGRLIYGICQKISEKKLGAKRSTDVIYGIEDFYLNDNNADSGPLYSEYRLFTKEFVIEVTMEVSGVIDGQDNGTWQREYNACEITHAIIRYKNKPVGNDKINEWINKHVNKFL